MIHPNLVDSLSQACPFRRRQTGDRVSTIDEHQSANPLRMLSHVSHRDRSALRPPDKDRAFDIGGVDDPTRCHRRRSVWSSQTICPICRVLGHRTAPCGTSRRGDGFTRFQFCTVPKPPLRKSRAGVPPSVSTTWSRVSPAETMRFSIPRTYPEHRGAATVHDCPRTPGRGAPIRHIGDAWRPWRSAGLADAEFTRERLRVTSPLTEVESLWESATRGCTVKPTGFDAGCDEVCT